LLRRCLERDRKMRLRDIGEARIILSSPAPVEAVALARSELKVWHYGAAALLAAFTFLIGWMLKPGAQVAEDPPTHRYSISAHLPLGETSVSISPDGKHISYVGREGMLWTRDLSQEAEARAIDGTPGAEFHCWSADSRFIALRLRGDLVYMPASGGATNVIARNLPIALACAWSGDGSLLYVGGG